jgi:hypothetical protein
MWDHRNYYVLSEVLWRTGHAVYGEGWTGYETTYRSSGDLYVMRNDLKKASRDFEQHLDQAKFLRVNIPENATDEEFKLHWKEIKNAEARSREARNKRDQLIGALRVPEQNQACFDRNANIQNRLIRAFSKDELVLQFGTGALIDWDEWAQHLSFRVSFSQSLIYAPSDLSGIRRATGFVLRESFDNWLKDILEAEVRLAKREGPEIYMEMRDWFLDWVQANPTKPSKEHGETLFAETFSPQGRTTFADLWKAFAPEQWRQRGRPKS